MKTRIITIVAAGLFLPVTLFADPAPAAAPAAGKKAALPKDHVGLGKAATGLMIGVMSKMGAIKNVEQAKAMAVSIKALPAKLEALVKAAEALPAPTDKATIEKYSVEVEKKAREAVQAEIEKRLEDSADPADLAAIGVELQGAIQEVDKKMEALVKRLEALYEIDGEEDGGE